MNKSESKYFNTAVLMDKAFLELLDTKDFEYITVKEICEKAGVNRSTFYLHYENIGDLLSESIAYMNSQFDSYFSKESRLNIDNIEQTSLPELFLITPQYLLPYLQYIKDHRKLFKISIEKANILGSNDKLNSMFEHVISPIMSRYKIPQENKVFMLSFYISGIIGIIKTWLNNGCQESIDFVLDIIVDCIKKPI